MHHSIIYSIDSAMLNSSNINLLPSAGAAFYIHSAIPNSEEYFELLRKTISWESEKIRMFGKTIITRRLSAWYSERGASYAYAGMMRTGLTFTSELLELKAIAEKLAEAKFNSVLANYYHDGADSMGWHTDAEKELDPQAPILSLSFGAERRFSFRHKVAKERVDVALASGSALIMDAVSQRHWHHSLPKAMKVKEPRINLTFRRMTKESSALQ